MYINKTQKGWKELASEVINSGKCVYCGACGAFCANIKFDVEKEVPFEDGSCEDANTCRDGYGLCYNLCPETEKNSFSIRLLDQWVFEERQQKILGHYLNITSVKIAEKAQEILPSQAGPLTALLFTAMKTGMIDAAIENDKDNKFRPVPFIAESKEDLWKGVGYKPSQGPTLSLIGEAINRNHSNIAVVGTPCQIKALRKLQNHPGFDFEAYDLVNLAIGTFCTGTFYNQLLNEIYKEKGFNDTETIRVSTDKDNFNLQIKTNKNTINIPLNYLYDRAIRKACFSCSDYTASFADISIGEFGSEKGYNTVIIRTKKGEKLLDDALNMGLVEKVPLDKEKEDLVLEITRNKTDIVQIEDIIEHSSEIKSYILRNGRIAKAYRPGMFVILWIPDYDFLPMSISSVEGNLIEITVQKVGEGTAKLFEMNVGDEIGIRGPFGTSFNYEDAKNILVVGGGMGIAALTSLIKPLKQNKKNVFVTIGAKDDASLIFTDRLIDLIPSTMCATEDGSVGKKCLVTDTMEEIIKEEKIDLIITCGPEIMMKRVLEIADSNNIEVQASLERKMKCGAGLCGSCCVGETNKVTVCKDGPVFNSSQLRSFPQFGSYKK